jgi:feruloyl esterase
MARDCADIAAAAPPEAEITSAALQPAGPFKMPAEFGPATTVQLPSFCRVEGVLHPTADSHIAFEVWLPADNWSGRFQGVGNGGFAGAIPYSGLVSALRSGDAVAASDTGHSAGGTDATWAKGHWEKVIDFGWRAVHLTAVAGKALTKAYYEAAPRSAYFISCSNGGRQGLMEAQRFPDDYDGIIAGAPAYNWTGLFTNFVWNARWLSPPAAAIPAAKTPAIASAVLAQCDKLDGLADGLLSDPRQCSFDPAVLRCTSGETNSCLTDPQISSLRAIYQGPRTPEGNQIYFGFLPGGESVSGSAGWDAWIFGGAPGASIQNAFGSNFVKYFVGAPEDWTPATFDFARDFDLLQTRTATTMNATDPDLSRFAARGGKLIMFHGWSDAAIPAQGTIAYRDAVVSAMGADRAAASMRLFLAPGMHHCAGGAGPSDFGQGGPNPGENDPATSLTAALKTWVEGGAAPEQVIARQAPLPGVPQSEAVRTGLICAYPKQAKLMPGGDPLRAESYQCRDPRPD